MSYMKKIAALGCALSFPLVASCVADIDPPYATANDPTLWITYPSGAPADPGNICLDAPDMSFPVHFVTFNAPEGSLVRFLLDRHRTSGLGIFLGTAPAVGGSPFTARLANLPGVTPVGEHVIYAEIVNGDGTPLTALQTENLSHTYQVRFVTRLRATGDARCPL
jgi:hypothetical protein